MGSGWATIDSSFVRCLSRLFHPVSTMKMDAKNP